MSLHYHEVRTTIEPDIVADIMILPDKSILREILETVTRREPNADCRIMELLIAYTIKLGFSISDVYDAYIEKNQENYKRLEEGY